MKNPCPIFERFQWVAHRGSHHMYPENTLPAFSAAVDLKATMVELDVQLSLDDEVMVFHDYYLSRLCGQRVSLRSLSAADLMKRVVKDNDCSKTAKITSLRQVFEKLSTQIYFYIELKTFKRDSDLYKKCLVKEVLSLVKEFDLEQSVLLVSFDRDILKMVYDCNRNVVLGLNTKGSFLPMKNISVICPFYRDVTVAKMHRWHAEGYYVVPWGIKKVKQMDEMHALNVNGLTTDVLPLSVPI